MSNLVTDIAVALEAVQVSLVRQHGQLQSQLTEAKARSVGQARTIKVLDENNKQLHKDLFKCKERIQSLSDKLSKHRAAGQGAAKEATVATTRVSERTEAVERKAAEQSKDIEFVRNYLMDVEAKLTQMVTSVQAVVLSIDQLRHQQQAMQTALSTNTQAVKRDSKTIHELKPQVGRLHDALQSTQESVQSLDKRLLALASRQESLQRTMDEQRARSKTRMTDLYRHVQVLTAALSRERAQRISDTRQMQADFAQQLSDSIAQVTQESKQHIAQTVQQVVTETKVQQAAAARRAFLSTVKQPSHGSLSSSGLFGPHSSMQDRSHMNLSQELERSDPYRPPAAPQPPLNAPPAAGAGAVTDPRLPSSEQSACRHHTKASRNHGLESALSELNDSVEGILSAAAATAASVVSEHESLEIPPHLMPEAKHSEESRTSLSERDLFALAAQVRW